MPVSGKPLTGVGHQGEGILTPLTSLENGLAPSSPVHHVVSDAEVFYAQRRVVGQRVTGILYITRFDPFYAAEYN